MERRRDPEGHNAVGFSKNLGCLWGICWEEGMEGKARVHPQEMSEFIR